MTETPRRPVTRAMSRNTPTGGDPFTPSQSSRSRRGTLPALRSYQSFPDIPGLEEPIDWHTDTPPSRKLGARRRGNVASNYGLTTPTPAR
ncbi:hypothetical protein GGH92_008012, partial [Coemansia sp. RSA 2673]